MTREFFINADFDLSLRSGRDPSAQDARGRQAAELPIHLLLLGFGGDSVIVPEVPPEEFLTYLERVGLGRPAVSVQPSIRHHSRFSPFGWNREADRLNRSYREPAPHPPLEVVRRVNGRRFAAAIERECFDDDSLLGEFTTVEALESCLGARPSDEKGWILKAEHGNAGLGNRRLRSRRLTPEDREVTRRLLVEDDCVLLEPWRRRLLDLAAIFDVDETGEVRGFDLHRVVNTADGAFIGAVFEKKPPALERWRPIMRRASGEVAGRLADAGYFGPVCLDAFVWDDGGEHRLRPLVDLNARLHVSTSALRLWRSWGGDTVVYWRLFSTRKLRLPGRYEELEAALGADAFDPGTRCGVLLTSPLRLGERERPPGRFGVLLAGRSLFEVEAMDRRLRGRFER